MKIRQGFVSNSSSSSFVIVGTRIPRKELEEMDWYDGDGETEKVPDGISIYYDESGYIVGVPLCYSHDWGLDSKDLTGKELSDIIFDVENKLNQRPIKLMMGTRQT